MYYTGDRREKRCNRPGYRLATRALELELEPKVRDQKFCTTPLTLRRREKRRNSGARFASRALRYKLASEACDRKECTTPGNEDAERNGATVPAPTL